MADAQLRTTHQEVRPGLWPQQGLGGCQAALVLLRVLGRQEAARRQAREVASQVAVVPLAQPRPPVLQTHSRAPSSNRGRRSESACLDVLFIQKLDGALEAVIADNAPIFARCSKQSQTTCEVRQQTAIVRLRSLVRGELPTPSSLSSCRCALTMSRSTMYTPLQANHQTSTVREKPKGNGPGMALTSSEHPSTARPQQRH